MEQCARCAMACINAEIYTTPLATCLSLAASSSAVFRESRRDGLRLHTTGIYSTAKMPTNHTPKEECGGGSAWAAGAIFAMLRGENDYSSVCLHGDILAALSQNHVGCHCQATREDFLAAVELAARGHPPNGGSPISHHYFQMGHDAIMEQKIK